MADKRKMEEYILKKQRVSIPALQQKFSADYYTVSTLVNDLVRRGVLFYDKGVDYVTAGAQQIPEVSEAIEEPFVRMIEENDPPREEERPKVDISISRRRGGPVQAFFDGLFNNSQKYNQTLLRGLYGDGDPLGEQLDAETKRLKALLEEDEGTDDEDDFADTFYEDGDDDDDEDFSRPMTDEELDEIIEACERRIASALAMEEVLEGETIPDTLNPDELAFILPHIRRAEVDDPTIGETSLVSYCCPRQRVGKDVARILEAVRDLFASVFDLCDVKAEIARIDVGYSAVGFTFKAERADYVRMQRYVAHYALGLFLHASVEEDPQIGLLKLVVPLPECLRKTLSVSYFVRTLKYPRKRGLFLAIGRTHEGEDIFCDLKANSLLIAGDDGVEGDNFLHGAVAALAKKYPPEKLRIFFAVFRHADFLPYENLTHAYAQRAVTTKFGLFALLDTLSEFAKPPKEGETRPQHILLVLNGLPAMDEAEREQFAAKMEQIAKARPMGVRVILSVNDASEEALPSRVIGLFGAKLCFRLSEGAGEREEFCCEGEGFTPLCAQSELPMGGGDGYFIAGGRTVRVQTDLSSSPRVAVQNINMSAARRVDLYSIAEPPSEMVTIEPPEKVFLDGLKLCVDSHNASISYVQRKCGIGFNHAGKIMEWMANLGYISEFNGCRPRRVFLSEDLFHDLYWDIY